MTPSGGRPERGAALSDLKNIGKVTERWLNQIGIHDEADLRRVGAVRAYRTIRTAEPSATLNLLYALHGALAGRHWNALPAAIKELLRREAEKGDRRGGGR